MSKSTSMIMSKSKSKRGSKAYEEVALLDFLSWEDSIVYVRGLGRTVLNSLRLKGLTPRKHESGKYRRTDWDAWMGKGQPVNGFKLPSQNEEELSPAAVEFKRAVGSME